MPRAWVVLRRAWIVAFIVAMGMVVLFPLMHGMSVRSQGVGSIQRWLLFSVASVLFLLPHPPQDVIVCTQRELFAWQFKSLLGSLIIWGSSWICVAQSVHARSDGWVALFSVLLVACLLVSPWFIRLCAWRLWMGMILVFVSRVV